MAEAHKRAYRHPKYKASYCIKNWPEYEKSLRNRGDITVWLSRDAINAWTPPKNGKRGGQPIYSDIAIEISLTLRLVFHLPLRQVEGFLKSILKLIDLNQRPQGYEPDGLTVPKLCPKSIRNIKKSVIISKYI